MLALGLLLLGVSGMARAAGNDVVVLTATGVVDGVMAGYLEDGINSAASEGAPAVVVRLNTPGGSLDATQQITSAFLEAPVPVIVYVSPAGGYAASAGTFITLAANLSYMAPGTNIGAIVRGNEVIIAHHDTVIESEDHVILFVINKRYIVDVEKLFQVGFTFI